MHMDIQGSWIWISKVHKYWYPWMFINMDIQGCLWIWISRNESEYGDSERVVNLWIWKSKKGLQYIYIKGQCGRIVVQFIYIKGQCGRIGVQLIYLKGQCGRIVVQYINIKGQCGRIFVQFIYLKGQCGRLVVQFIYLKGQCGRIAVFGGCILYTGAPYFAAISALKVSYLHT